jgi:DNA-binding MarR family transcriptional regulator
VGKLAADVAVAASDLELLLGRLRRRLRAEAPSEGIPLSQMAVLCRLVRDGSHTASALAAAEHVRVQSMALTIANLEAQRLVERVDDPEDRRRVLVMATDAGRTLVQQVRRSREAWLARAIVTCFAEEEQETLVKAMALFERLADCDPDACPRPLAAGDRKRGRNVIRNHRSS